MPWWMWLLLAVAAGLLLIAGLVVLLLREAWLGIPPEERRSCSEIRQEAPAMVRELLSGFADDWREHRRVRARMDARAREARRQIYDKQYERTRDEIRREG